MNLLVTSRGVSPECEIDPHFGRARIFLLGNTETRQWTAHDNMQNLNAAQGAGIQAAELAVRLQAQAVITGHIGPKAFAVLQAAGVPVFLVKGGTPARALEAYGQGQLQAAAQADQESHWI